MADLEQMIPEGIEFITQSGCKFILPRLTIATRRKAIGFVVKLEEIRDSDIPESEKINQILDELSNLLEFWLKKNYPDITKEQIEETWDFVDVPGLTKIITNMEAQIQAVSPPDSSAPNRAERRSKK